MKQQQLTFEKGITNIPSDAVCSDNALEESLGMVFRDGEHHVVQPPKKGLTAATYSLAFVHKVAGGDNYIYNTGIALYYNGSTITGSGYTGTLKGITAIGNILIASLDGNVKRFIFNGSSYTSYDNIPEPEVSFWLSQDIDSGREGYSLVKNSQKSDGILHNTELVKGAQDKYNDMVTGLYAKNLKAVAQKKGFAEPFMARVALELYDGSYAFITNPVLLLPCMSKNSHGQDYTQDFVLRTRFSQLYCTQLTDYSAYGEIVKDVVVFVSDGVHIYDTTVDQPFDEVPDNVTPLTDGIVMRTYTVDSSSVLLNKNYETHRDNATEPERRWFVLKQRSNQEISNDISGISVFYKLCSLGITPVTGINTSTKIDTHTLENITTQEQLPYDDYYSRNSLKADYLYAYNSRLNLAQVKRGFFGGFDYFMPLDNNTSSQYAFFVTIKTDKGDIIVQHNKTTTQKQGIFFYYPDPRAKHVSIMKGSAWICDQDLTEHPGLHGAYYFRGVTDVEPSNESPSTTPSATSNAYETLDGYVLTSEVNNPFLFRPSGYNRVGTGKVIGMAALTTALSQGQFGQYPLIVFTTEGIWAMSLDNTGLYMSSHPMSREVALASNPCITQTDGSIFFASKKGLMVVSGNQVLCVSSQLSGKSSEPFEDYMEHAFIAYDYRDSLLWIFDGATHTSNEVTTVGSDTCWVYSMKSGTFARFKGSFTIARAVANYPDYIVQDKDKYLYSFQDRDNINHDDTTYGTKLISRPLKLENALALKTIMDAKHIMRLSSGATISWKLMASNNMDVWAQLTSLRGKPWKYYKFEYNFSNLKAVDTFAGTVIVTEERRTNKLR